MTYRKLLAAASAAVVITTVVLGLVAGAAAEQAENADPKPTVVLVQGGFADASGWDGVN